MTAGHRLRTNVGDSRIAWIILGGALLLTALVYVPSLHGGYLFDDKFYTDADDVHITSLRPGEWIRAALSQAGTHQFRALGMLTFAANYYFTGLDPFWLKLTNLGIHLANGMLLFLMLRELFALRAQVAGASPDRRSDVVAAAISCAWLLLPIHLSSVAYVSQRLEALANVFVFLGLYLYLRLRRHDFAGRGSALRLPLALAGCLILGVSAKESAALLPLYTFCVEFVITRFRDNTGRLSRPALWTHVVLLLLPLFAGLAWLSTWAFQTDVVVRPFTTAERLLTEPRVLVHYLDWILLPNLGALTFYHDDLPISRGLLDPPTTLLAILALTGLLGAAIWKRRTYPLFCLGILWFFAGHAMTATIIPLELVFEHRNYFPSAGVLLAVGSFVAWDLRIRLPVIRTVAVAGFVGYFAFTTLLRSEEWSHPLRLAYSEALKRPGSARAQYELARTLILAAGGSYRDSPLINESRQVLLRAADNPDSGIAPLQALIYLDSRAHRQVDPRWWRMIVQKLRDHIPSQTDIDCISFLFHCQLHGDCPLQKQELLDVFLTALPKAGNNVYLMSAYADFAFSELGDKELAENMFRGVVGIKPEVPVYRANLIRFLVATGQYEKADTELAMLRAANHLGSLDEMIRKIDAEIVATKDASKPAGSISPSHSQIH